MGTYCFGIDVGGTTVKCGLFRTDGTLVEKWEIPTRKENNGDQILPDVAAAVNAKMEEKGISKEEVEGVGIGVPGPVNSKGEVSRAVNLFWGYKNVVGEMEELTGETQAYIFCHPDNQPSRRTAEKLCARYPEHFQTVVDPGKADSRKL